ncbi:MAG: hypothetical protein Q4G49_16050 [Paracoccus sp. (in: a-proteobacteria)]|nr:hypothetical protein [Paracoccus sp. (in: a-proteobacteria)]
MPNYSKAEQELLSETDLALMTRSRGETLVQADDSALMALIAEITAARDSAGQPGGPSGKRTRYDLLNAALRRCNDERRARGVKTDGSKPGKTARPRADKAPIAEPAPAAALPAAKPAPAKGRNAAKRGGGRKIGQPLDKRTGPRRIPKVKPPAPVAAVAGTNPSAAEADDPKAARREQKKSERKADRQAAKEAEKAARKAEKLAEKQAGKEARKAARKAEKQAAKDAEKAARKAAKGKSGKDDTAA